MPFPTNQYRLLMDTWKTHEVSIRQKILTIAQDPPMENWGGAGMKPYFYTDGLWDALPDNTEYDVYCQYHGNADDECQLLVRIWILVMAESGNPDFLPYIKDLTDQEINGL